VEPTRRVGLARVAAAQLCEARGRLARQWADVRSPPGREWEDYIRLGVVVSLSKKNYFFPCIESQTNGEGYLSYY
jgi:hypothetical protein